MKHKWKNMTIKKRLKLSYIAMLLLPILFIIIAGGFIKSVYLDRDNNFSVFFNHAPELISENQYKFTTAVNQQITDNPELVFDMDYLKELETSLPYDECGLIILRNKEIIYITEAFNKDEFKSLYAKPDAAPLPESKESKKLPVILFKWNFRLENNDTGTIILLFNWYELSRKFVRNGVFFIILVILIIIVVNGVLTYYVSKSIIDPLNVLKSAAIKIKDGELNSEIKYRYNDEFKEVMTAFEQMRIKLKESLNNQIIYEENRKELISNISHDLRTPITAIKGYIEGLRDGVADSPEKIRKYIETILIKADILEHLIEELFLFSKLDLKKVQFNFKKINLNSFLIDCLTELKFDYKNMEINYNFNNIENAEISGDPNHLKRVISNIVNNADKYNDKEKTVIHVEVLEKDKSFYTVKLKDNGPGILEENIDYIFNRMYREDLSRNSDKKGSGLGLSIAKQIIEGHNGRIRAESTLHEGTTIIIELRKFNLK